MKIGILGGTFNPIHNGHLWIADEAIKRNKLDKVWIVPTYATPGKHSLIELATGKQRFSMIKAAIKTHGNKQIQVKNFEIKIKHTSYTIDTIKMLTEKYPEYEFYLIMGDDAYLKIDSWKDSDKIKELAKFIVFRRNREVDHNFENIDYYNDFSVDISSTSVFKNAAWNHIPEGARKYIAKHMLYIKSLAYWKLPSVRYTHTLSVATHAKRLADKSSFCSPKLAYKAGLAHDIFKYENDRIMTNTIEAHPDYDIPPMKVFHSYYAAIWFTDVYKTKNKKFISAIRKHTVADGKMSKLDKIIYVSDKIANDRKGSKARIFRKRAYEDLNSTFAQALFYSSEKVVEKGGYVHFKTKQALKKYWIYGKPQNKSIKSTKR